MRRDRDRRQSRRRSRRAGEARAARRSGLITNAGAEHLEGFGSSRAWRAPKAKWSRRSTPSATAVINADDEFADLWRGMTARRASSTFGVDAAGRFLARPTCRTEHRRRRVSSRVSRCARRPARCRIELHLAGRHNVLNALCAAAAAMRRRRRARRCARGPCHDAPVPGRLQFEAAPSGALARRRFLQRQSRARCAPAIEVLASVDARRWLVHGRHGRARRVRRRRVMREIGRFARNHRIDRAVRHRHAVARSRSRPSVAGARVVRRHRGAGARGQRRAARAKCRVLVKGSRIEPARARGRGAGRQAARMHRDRTRNACCTGSPNY